MTKEWILSQRPSSILGKNTGRAVDQTSNILFSSPQRYRLGYEARLGFHRKSYIPTCEYLDPLYKIMHTRGTGWGRGFQRKLFKRVSSCWCLTHYQTTNFRLFQTERVCRQQFQIWRKWQKVIQMGRKHCGERRNCSLRAISPFPTVFSNGSFPRGVKRCHCVGMGSSIRTNYVSLS